MIRERDSGIGGDVIQHGNGFGHGSFNLRGDFDFSLTKWTTGHALKQKIARVVESLVASSVARLITSSYFNCCPKLR